MRELHVVALSEDGRSVLLATTKTASTGAFRLKLEGKLTAALRGDLPRPGEPERAPSVTPKEIQARMRAGESAEQIAAEAGVPVSRIERFAGPVLSERERVIEEARAAFLSRGRLGPSLLPLGDAVDAVLAETPSLRGDTVTWTARRLDSGHWLVQVSYVARARTRTGSWVYDPHTRSLVPSDQPSAVMGHTGEDMTARKPARGVATPVARKPARAKPARKAAARPVAKAAKAPARPAARPAAKPAAKAARPAAKPAARPAARPAAKPAAKPAARPAAKPAAKAAKPAAKKAAPTKATPRRVTKPKAAPVRTATPAAAERAAEKLAHAMVAAAEEPTAVETFEPVAPAAQAPPPPPPPPPAPEPKPEPVVAAAPEPEPESVELEPEPAEPEQERPPLRVVPAPPAELVPTPVPKRRAAGERAHVPDWADVLFGAAPHKDRKDG